MEQNENQEESDPITLVEQIKNNDYSGIIYIIIIPILIVVVILAIIFMIRSMARDRQLKKSFSEINRR